MPLAMLLRNMMSPPSLMCHHSQDLHEVHKTWMPSHAYLLSKGNGSIDWSCKCADLASALCSLKLHKQYGSASHFCQPQQNPHCIPSKYTCMKPILVMLKTYAGSLPHKDHQYPFSSLVGITSKVLCFKRASTLVVKDDIVEEPTIFKSFLIQLPAQT